MTAIEDVKSQISQAKQRLEQTRQQAQEQKSLIGQRRQESLQAEAKIREQEKKLPTMTQSRLRSGLYTGLEGRKRRQIISKIRKGLGQKQKEIGLFKGSLIEKEEGLAKYETDVLKPFETQIASKEAEISAYETKTAALSRARDIYLSTSPYAIFSLEYESGLVKDYYKQLVKTDYSILKSGIDTPITPKIPSQAPFYGQSVPFDSLTPTPIYGSSGELVGIDDPIQKVSRLPTTFETSLYGKKNIPSFSLPQSLFSISPPKDLKRIDIIKEFGALRELSAGNKLIIEEAQFRTTGSPMRMTKISSFKSRGYIPTPSIKTKFKTPSLFRKEKSVSLPKKKKSKFGSTFSFGKKIKGKKKTNLWGF